MAKQKYYSLDAQETIDYYADMLETTSIILWNTRYPAYTFAYFLNKLYDLNLEPESDIAFTCGKKEVNCSVYSYHNFDEKNSYFLIDNSVDTMQRIKDLSYFNRVLLVMGVDCCDKADYICGDLQRENSASSDLLAEQREEIRRLFVSTGIVEMTTFDFSDPDEPTTSFLASATPGSSLYRKQQKFLSFQKDYFQGLFVAIDGMMKDFD